jgi:hypothetical protein
MMAKTISLEWKNLPKFRKALEKYGHGATLAAAGALYREAQRIITTSKAGFVPVDSGALRSSGFVEPPQITGHQISVTMGFGGSAGRGNQGETNDRDVGYALVVHEVQVFHPVGQSHYLSVPLRAALVDMDDRLAADIRRGR